MMTDDEFDRQNKTRWTAAIDEAFPFAPPRSATWDDLQAIAGVLTPFMGENLNHTMMPGSGGLDMHGIDLSPESGCLEFSRGHRMIDTFQPATLFFEHFPKSPWNSFFLIETRPLAPTDVYEEFEGDYEELVEIEPGDYIDRSARETGILGYDDAGDRIDLPNSARYVSRHLKGKFLVVAKRSIWNRNSATYDGRHNEMTAQDIRNAIQRALINAPARR